MKKLVLLFSLLLVPFFSALIQAQVYNYTDNRFNQGLSLEQQTPSSVSLNFSITQFQLDDTDVDGTLLKSVHMPGVFLPNNEGAPDLPGIGQYVALPHGASPNYKITYSRVETLNNVEIAPAPRIPKENEKGPLFYSKNSLIYSVDKYYPENPVLLSPVTQVRGVDAVIVGVTPFQYNPVTKTLLVYRDLKVEVSFNGGNGQFGENRLRNRWWDPMLRDIFINYNSLPVLDYTNKNISHSETPDLEYIIITPDNVDFKAWADSIKNFRLTQGIKAGVVTLTEIGGNTTTAIETYINNAYNTWTIPPVAVLLLADYGTGAATGNGITSPVYDNYCKSDHIYADVNSDHMAEIVFARITAQNATHLQTIVGKLLKYDRQPPTNPIFYDKPVTAMGWQTERWFQLCSEIVNGFWQYKLGKHPVRENAIYSGTPGSVWSSNQNTNMVVSYFGPSGTNYIPQTPAHLTDWGGNATRVNNDINQGTFMLQHRDHGMETGWGEPGYTNTNVNALNNTDLPFILSINCLTGKFDYSSECFAEAFHRHQKGAVGLIAATEVSYSFVNDAYLWGFFDNLWPEFMPTMGTAGPVKVYPSFANVAGKFFLQASNWPYNTSNKEVTYYLFHHHGDAFTSVYSEMPQNLTVTHNPVLLSGETSFTVTADDGALIGLSVNGQLIGSADATGAPVNITIPPQLPGNNLLVTITKQNYYRYATTVQTIPPAGAYVIHESCTITDSSLTDMPGNGNGLLDYGESVFVNLCTKNVGTQNASNVTVTLRTSDSLVTITDSTEVYGAINANSSLLKYHAFKFTLSSLVPDKKNVNFTVVASDGANTWTSYFSLLAHAPKLEYVEYALNDSAGNNNGRLDPGETVQLKVKVKNTGTSMAFDVAGEISTANTYITLNTAVQNFGGLDTNAVVEKRFVVTASQSTPAGNPALFNLNITGTYGLTAGGSFTVIIGQIPVLILDLDPNTSSANKIKTAIENNSVTAQLSTAMPSALNLYTSIFVCLGIYSSNHKLTATEGQQLADYLNGGGRLYMEGGDTWCYDTPTAVHPMFKILKGIDGSSNLATIQGQAGTIAEGMNFTYSGENSYIDQVSAIAPAKLMFKNSTPVYGCGVSYAPTTPPLYKTVGTSFEFGGLTDGVSPATKDSLMKRILIFFNLLDPTPVELIAFTAIPSENSIVLNWETATELNNMGFDLERSSDNKVFSKIGTISGKGTVTEKQHYSFVDNNLTGKGKYWYRIKQIDYDGTSSLSQVVEVEYSAVPTVFNLSQNYPNPFNPSTTIKFSIPEKSSVLIKVYDAIGREVETLVNKDMEPGYYKYDWNASKHSSGVYFYRMQAGSFTSVKKLMLVK